MAEQNYNIVIIDEAKTKAVVRLNESVLGGTDALEFSQAIESIREKGAKLIIADLKNVAVMNSSGLGMLVSALSSLKNNSVAFVLCSVPKKIMALLEVTHLNQVFSIFNNCEDASKHID